jgi:hypothetical protein
MWIELYHFWINLSSDKIYTEKDQQTRYQLKPSTWPFNKKKGSGLFLFQKPSTVLIFFLEQTFFTCLFLCTVHCMSASSLKQTIHMPKPFFFSFCSFSGFLLMYRPALWAYCMGRCPPMTAHAHLLP